MNKETIKLLIRDKLDGHLDGYEDLISCIEEFVKEREEKSFFAAREWREHMSREFKDIYPTFEDYKKSVDYDS